MLPLTPLGCLVSLGVTGFRGIFDTAAPSQNVSQHLWKRSNPNTMGLLLRNAKYPKVPVEASRPEAASHLGKYQLCRVWLGNDLIQNLPVTDSNITLVFADLLYQDTNWVHGNAFFPGASDSPLGI